MEGEIETVVTINGQKIPCLIITGADGKTWKRYGPVENKKKPVAGFLHYYESSKKWSVMFDYNAVVTDITLAKRNREERDFLNELEALHVASINSVRNRVYPVPPARRTVRHALLEAIQKLDPKPFEKMAESIKALAELKRREGKTSELSIPSSPAPKHWGACHVRERFAIITMK